MDDESNVIKNVLTPEAIEYTRKHLKTPSNKLASYFEKHGDGVLKVSLYENDLSDCAILDADIIE